MALIIKNCNFKKYVTIRYSAKLSQNYRQPIITKQHELKGLSGFFTEDPFIPKINSVCQNVFPTFPEYV